jgi:hypothetical protein
MNDFVLEQLFSQVAVQRLTLAAIAAELAACSSVSHRKLLIVLLATPASTAA